MDLSGEEEEFVDCGECGGVGRDGVVGRHWKSQD